MVLIALFSFFVIWVTGTESLLSNTSLRSFNHDLPEIHDGESCVPNQLYRLDCNTCRCEEDHALLCTKMACMQKYRYNLKKHGRDQKSKGLNLKPLSAKNKKGKRNLPALPDDDCVPGKVYQLDCYACFCEDSKQAVCSEKRKACETPYYPPQQPEDVRPKFTEDELASMPTLPHSAARCEPGKSYKVQCNTCICLPNYSLFCDHLLCLSHDDMHRIEADKKSGKPCKKGESLPSSPCVKCFCENAHIKCQPVYGCVPPEPSLRQLHGSNQKIKPKMVLDVDSHDKCLPGAVYKDHCNRCYCQKNGGLKCTRKLCLNYVQTMQLKKHRLYLEKHGL